MKKIKFVGLPLLALTAIAGLTNCGNEGTPKQKPGVIFHASARVINSDLSEEAIDFRDKECAEVTIENEESLQYGKQDVVVTIEPKAFFSFRKYELDDWKPIGAPVHPYVGLGSPVSLYNYPLQENVAWTFEDLSEPSESAPGFYKEKYQITIKKEYFQKNIVIDYGNVEGKDNKIYVWNSTRYEAKFKESATTIEGGFGELYQMSEEASSFAAASKGITVSYSFKISPNLYTFEGWDQPKSLEEGSDYLHFKLWGIKDATNEKVNIAKYNPSAKEEDRFTVTAGSDYVSFFIGWGLLAEGQQKGYASKYDKIEVEFSEPSTEYSQKVIVDEDSGITVYPGDIYQYSEPGKKTPYKPANHEGEFLTYDPTSKESLTFKNVFDTSTYLDGDYIIYYSTLFKLPDSENPFSITIGGEKVFDIDLVNRKNNITEWRDGMLVQQQGQTGEADLFHWEYPAESNAVTWHLVQLNPSGKIKGQKAKRTYGLPSNLQGGDNLYYLYTDNLSPFKDSSTKTLNISIDIVTPKLTTFKLDNASGDYGQLEQSTYPVGDKTEVTIGFKPKSGYETTAFDVKVFKGTTELKDFVATYDNWNIRIISPVGVFGEGVEYTINLSIPATKVKLGFNVSDLGKLIVDGNKVTEYEPVITGTTKSLTFDFKFEEAYNPAATKDDYAIEVYCNGASINRPTIVNDSTDNRLFHITVTTSDDEAFKPEGVSFEINVRYIQVNYNDNGFGSAISEKIKFNEWAGKQGPITVLVDFDSGVAPGSVQSIEVTTQNPATSFVADHGDILYDGDSDTYSVEIYLHTENVEELMKEIPNGLVLNINATYIEK